MGKRKKSKITVAKLSKFVAENDTLYYRKCVDAFDEGVDVKLAERINENLPNTLGIAGVWLTRNTPNLILEHSIPGYTGYLVQNICCSFCIMRKV